MSNPPEGMNTITPQMIVSDSRAAMALYERAFGATIGMVMEMPGTDGIMHAEFKIGDSTIFISDEMPQMPRKAPSGDISPVAFYLYVDDVDAVYQKAVDHGLEGVSEPEDMFWGDRTAVLHDPFGYNWTLAQQVRVVTPEDMQEGMKQMMSGASA